MKGQRIGYIRVSTFDQKPDRQLEQVAVDRTFIDKASGKDTNRPGLAELLSFVRTDTTFEIQSVLKLDSLDMTDADRAELVKALDAVHNDRIIITHGTDTMPETARYLR